MPELPEVQLVSNHLDKKLKNDSISSVEVLFEKLLKNIGRAEFAEKMKGFSFSSISRKGKYLLFSDPHHLKWMTVHLGMTGAFFISEKNEEKKSVPLEYLKHQHLTFQLKSGRKLIYCDIRKFGDIRFFDKDPIDSYEPFLKMGPDPLFEEDSSLFQTKLSSKTFCDKEIKPSLLDSRLIAGVGNIYACEVLFRTGIHPERKCGSLSLKELDFLYTEISSIFRLSIEQGGSSVSNYVNSEGNRGNFQDFHQIYQKSVCSNCGSAIQKSNQNKRSTFFCPLCQT